MASAVWAVLVEAVLGMTCKKVHSGGADYAPQSDELGGTFEPAVIFSWLMLADNCVHRLVLIQDGRNYPRDDVSRVKQSDHGIDR